MCVCLLVCVRVSEAELVENINSLLAAQLRCKNSAQEGKSVDVWV